jgi:hypothetical protein
MKNAPVVNYILWPKTVEALQVVESSHPTLWFLTEDGNPLKTSKIVNADDPANAKHSEWSVVENQWKKWRESGKVPNKQFKMLRKTGATTIGDSEYAYWKDLYLADKPQSIAGRHYDIKSGKVIPELDKAIEYLGRQFGLVE